MAKKEELGQRKIAGGWNCVTAGQATTYRATTPCGCCFDTQALYF